MSTFEGARKHIKTTKMLILWLWGYQVLAEHLGARISHPDWIVPPFSGSQIGGSAMDEQEPSVWIDSPEEVEQMPDDVRSVLEEMERDVHRRTVSD
jgi:hypothetical protein